jgi:hypothetical protein
MVNPNQFNNSSERLPDSATAPFVLDSLKTQFTSGPDMTLEQRQELLSGRYFANVKLPEVSGPINVEPLEPQGIPDLFDGSEFPFQR